MTIPPQQSVSTTPTQPRGWRRWWPNALGMAIVVGLSVGLYLAQDRIAHLQTYGYPGVFLFSLLANASVILPMPSLVLPYVLGAVLSPWGVALAAGTGAALGEITGYIAGWSGKAVVEDSRRYQQVQTWMARYGEWTVLALAFLPLPLMDLAGIVAGATRMPLWRFLLWCWIGKVLKMLAVAALGAWLL
ncbi:MAG: VTT domain-containing protein [Chloroflexi bacterium]|nr:VTT domain-containing protein [Chloroflexota bacterium]